MKISELGEFKLIDRLTKDIRHYNKSTLHGIGDDCAVMDYSGKKLLATTDVLLEGIHFDLTYTPLKHLGYKAAVVNFSDIYAMNGEPKQILVTLGVSSRFEVEDLEEIYAGIILACDKYKVDFVGGDTSASMTGLTLNITCLGEGEDGKIVYRSGANVTDLVCVSGNLGAAYMGLQILEREKRVFEQVKDPHFQPDFATKEYILERQLKPEARRDIIERLRESGIQPTAMMDVSDGLSSEVMHICQSSDCGCEIYEEKIPIDYLTATTAEELNMNLTTVALNGGEDYELLFTVPLADYDKIKSLDDIHVIGHITPKEKGTLLITREGTTIPFRAQGWNSLE